MELPPEHRLERFVLAAGERYGGEVAIRAADGETTYAALAEATAENGRRLTGVRGRAVLVAVGNTRDDLAAIAGVWAAGGVAVPVARSSPLPVMREIADRTGSEVLVTGGPLPAEWRGALGAGPVHAILRDTALKVPAELDRNQAFVAFTSGSTGRSKGVVVPHRAFAEKLAAIQSVLPFAPGETTLQPLQLHFAFCHWTSLLTLATGGTVHLVERFAARQVLENLARPVARIPVVPTMLRLILREVQEAPDGADLAAACAAAGSPTTWIAGGEPLPSGLGRRFRELFPHAGIADVFGLSETSTSDFILTPDRYDACAGTLGDRPSPGVEARVARPDGSTCGEGEPGELLLRTPYLMTGYLDDPETTAAAMSGSWFRTGDLAEWTPQGRLRLVGRTKNLIVRGGIKVAPLEIEAVYSGYPGCHGALAVGLADPVLGERIHLIMAVTGESPDISALRDWGRRHLDRGKLPDVVHRVDSLPLGRTGKVDRVCGHDLVRQRTAQDR
ncbi:fatty acid--CoA ligase family protein [Streptomyces sp. SL13]|uniref:Fatty acid--CoA ligase family protein n=1 Tax=Streptantibioticus silvisoli TaxID=2705255 RepID=A0AA90H8V7_9ACTN|nr:fatty acid--CoA ligase family protein [Streptantibioticus silvisoli]MDI5963965.1 fatty acid--CoA ligase family protein [Streptantibioticus silvisoli]MDI5970072.1 fatty acid--CoA ligase family protein [Streptantibioticus silvisoli]